MISSRIGGGSNPGCSSIIFKYVKLFFLLQSFTIWVRVRFKEEVRNYLQLFKILKAKSKFHQILRLRNEVSDRLRNRNLLRRLIVKYILS